MSNPLTRPLGAQISHMLKARGVEVIFGIPGVHNQEMYRGIEEAGITHVLARHEQGAGFMADGYARASGKVGVAYVITGPGLCNIMTPMGQAYSDSVPMLVISSCLDETATKRGQLHQMRDQRAAAATVCDWSEEARTPEAAYGLIDRALTELQVDRQRPKHIQVPIEVLSQPAPPAGPQSSLAAPDTISIEAALAPVLRARRPLFVFGGGVVKHAHTVRRLMKALGAASFTSYAGRGIAGLEDPLHFGAFMARPDSARVFAQADLVVAVGTELAQVDLWRDTLGHEGAFIRIDKDASVLANGPQGMHLRCDAGAALGKLLDMAKGHAARTDWNASDVARARALWRSEIDAERPGLVPVVDTLCAAVPEDTMIYSDMTQLAYVAKEVWDMDRPGHWHHPTGFGTLGYALPAAIGGAVARQGKPTMVIVGDYGFHYTMQELGVAVELGLSLPIILWDNGKLGEIEDSMVRAQIAPNAVVARNPDFCRLAEAFGAAAVAPQSFGALAQDLHAAFARQGPTLIHLTPSLTG